MKEKYFYGYNIVAGGFIIQSVCIGAMFTYGIFFKEFQAEFGWSRTLISGASSLAFLMMGAVGILAGRLNDKIGPRIIITVSSISLGIGYILMSTLRAPWQLYLFYGLLVSMGFSTHDVITLSMVARWFEKRRGIMTGIVKVGTGFGQLTVPLIATSLIGIYGWRVSYFIIGSSALIILVAVARVLRRDPQSAGLLPDGGSNNKSEDGNDLMKPDISLREALFTKQLWILCLILFSSLYCLFTIIVHLVPYATDTGLDPAAAAGLLSVLGGISMLGRIVMGTVIDRIGGKRSLIICFIVLLIGLICLQISDNPAMLFLFAAINGFAHGAFFTVTSPTMAEIFGTSSHGVLFGIVLFSGTIGGSLGPVLAGHIFDTTGKYRLAFILLIAVALIGFSLITMLHPIGSKEK